MKLEVPFFSQHDESIEERWRTEVCAIACVKMVLEFYGTFVSAKDLIEDGERIGGYAKVGWSQDAMVMLLRNNGLSAYREEFKSIDDSVAEKLFSFGLDKIFKKLKEGPVLISVFGEEGRAHLVTGVGYEENEDGSLKGFYVHNPNGKNENEGAFQFLDINEAKDWWRRMAIFPSKL